MAINEQRAIDLYVNEKRPDGRPHSLQDVADELDCTAPGVRYVLIKHGIPLRPRGGNSKNVPLDEERVLKLLSYGLGVNTIAKELGVDWRRVVRFLTRLGVPRLVGRLRTLDDAKIVQATVLRAQKRPWAFVARKVGVPATTVRKALADRKRVGAAFAAIGGE